MSHSRPGWCGVRLGVEGAPVAAVRLGVGQVEVVAGEHGLLAAGHHLAARSGTNGLRVITVSGTLYCTVQRCMSSLEERWPTDPGVTVTSLQGIIVFM